MKRILPILSIAFLFSIQLQAQVQEYLTPGERKHKTVVTEPQTLYKGFFRGMMAVSYSTFDKYFTPDGKRESIGSNIWANSWFLQASMMYGITDRLQVEVLVPYRIEVSHQSVSVEVPEQQDYSIENWSTQGTGLGDMTISTAYQLFTETETRHSLTAFLNVNIPTGEKNPTNIKDENEYNKPVGSGEMTTNLQLTLRKIRYPFSYSVFASYEYSFGGEKLLSPLDTEEKKFRSGDNMTVGGSFYFHLNDWVAIRNSIDYFNSQPDEYDGEKEEEGAWLIQYYPGLSFQVKQFRISQAVIVPLFGKLVSADPSYIVLVQYTF